jgi:hypothetical protein
VNNVALCSTASVKAIVTPKTVTDAEIGTLIDHASSVIALDTGASTDASDNVTLNIACVHLSAAYVLRKMKLTGELAASVAYSDQSQSNKVDEDIAHHHMVAAQYIKKYIYSVSSYPIIAYARVGPQTVDSEAYHG